MIFYHADRIIAILSIVFAVVDLYDRKWVVEYVAGHGERDAVPSVVRESLRIVPLKIVGAHFGAARPIKTGRYARANIVIPKIFGLAPSIGTAPPGRPWG